jgi:hypothetical protein
VPVASQKKQNKTKPSSRRRGDLISKHINSVWNENKLIIGPKPSWNENKLIIGPKPRATVLARTSSNLRDWSCTFTSLYYFTASYTDLDRPAFFLCEEVQRRGCVNLEGRIQSRRERVIVIYLKTVREQSKPES